MPGPRRRNLTTVKPEPGDFWARREPDGSYVFGFTDDAQGRMGPVVFFRGPRVGREYSTEETAMTLESEKCVRQLALPVGGTVVEMNRNLEADPGAINQDPYGRGWVCRLRPSRVTPVESVTERPPRTPR